MLEKKIIFQILEKFDIKTNSKKLSFYEALFFQTILYMHIWTHCVLIAN